MNWLYTREFGCIGVDWLYVWMRVNWLCVNTLIKYACLVISEICCGTCRPEANKASPQRMTHRPIQLLISYEPIDSDLVSCAVHDPVPRRLCAVRYWIVRIMGRYKVPCAALFAW